MPIHLGFGLDRGYLAAFATALASVVAHNPTQAFVAHVVIEPLGEADLAKIAALADQLAVKIRLHYLSDAQQATLPKSGSWPAAIYNRLFLCDFVANDTDQLLYLDCDIIALGPLPPLPVVVEGAVAAVLDVEVAARNAALARPADTPYLNSGVLLINVPRWNRDAISVRVLAELRNNPQWAFPDQDALNRVLAGRFIALDRRWNTFWTLYQQNPPAHQEAIFLHFTGNKPWHPWNPEYLQADFARHSGPSPWPVASLNPLSSRLHRRLYARHLFRRGHWGAGLLWFGRYLMMDKR